MRALVFGVQPEPWEAPEGANPLVRNLARTPMRLMEVDDAKPLRPDWVVVRPRMTGICGSDSKQALLDFSEGKVEVFRRSTRATQDANIAEIVGVIQGLYRPDASH